LNVLLLAIKGREKNNNAVHNLAFVQWLCKMKAINQSVGYCIWHIKCV